MLENDQLHDYLIAPKLFHSIITPIGIVGNILMCIATVCGKRLHSPCHKLIGVVCFCDALHAAGHLPFLYGLYTDTKWIQQKNCFFLMFLPAFGALVGLALLFNLGVDRIIAITWPTIYRQNQDRWYYMACHLAQPLTYFIGFAVIAFQTRTETPVMCFTPQFFSQHAGMHWAFSSIFINALIVSVYSVVYYKITNLRTNMLGSSAKAVAKSILITVLFVVGGWLTTMTVMFTAILLGAGENELSVVQGYAGLLVNTSCACNFFVYYYISSDYRQEIRRLFGYADKKKSFTMVVSTVLRVTRL